MPRGPSINKNVERIIRTVKEKHPEMTAKEIRVEVRSQIPNAKLYPENWPSDDAIQKLLKKDREEKIKAGPDLKDKLWGLIYTNIYPIPTDALPIVLKVWSKALEINKPITIREALWVSKLHPFFKLDAYPTMDCSNGFIARPKLNYDIDNLLIQARQYAQYEKVESINLANEDSFNTPKDFFYYWMEDANLLCKIDELEGNRDHYPLYLRLRNAYEAEIDKYIVEHPEEFSGVLDIEKITGVIIQKLTKEEGQQ